MPEIRQEIAEKLKNSEAKLTDLGPEVASSSARLQLFANKIHLVSFLTKSAVNGVYNHEFFDGKNMKLRALIVNKEEEFRSIVSKTHVSCPGNLQRGYD